MHKNRWILSTNIYEELKIYISNLYQTYYTAYNKGYRFHYGGWRNRKSAIYFNDENEFAVKKTTYKKPFIFPSLRYHFTVTKSNGIVRFQANEIKTGKETLDLVTKIPDIETQLEEQHIGFWT